MEKEFSHYDPLQLTSSIAGLQLWPPNHVHTLRLDEAARIALSIKAGGHAPVHATEIGEVLNRPRPSTDSLIQLEDPLEDVFTDNVIFHGGNYIVYPGIDAGAFVLKIILTSIFRLSDPLPDSFLARTRAASTSILSVSNEIASRLKHRRYMESPDNCKKAIEVPNQATLAMLADAVKFTEKELNALLWRIGLDFKDLEPFVLKPESVDVRDDDPQRNPLLMKPLVSLGDNIVVASPSSIMLALRHFILSMAHEYELLHAVADRYRTTLSAFVNEYNRLLSLGRMDGLDGPTQTRALPMVESFFKIDIDKVAYVQLLTDDLTDFRPDEVCGTWKNEELSKGVAERSVQVIEWLKAGGLSYCRNVLVVTVLGSFGRDAVFGHIEPPRGARSILADAGDLEILCHLRQFDSLTLWKFAGAEQKMMETTSSLSFSFLDSYALYKERNDSLYITDETKPTFLVIQPGQARSLRVQAARLVDLHAAKRLGGINLTPVCRFNEDEAIPIYFPEGGIGRTMDRLVEGYLQPIWIECQDEEKGIPKGLWDQHLKITDMLAYWFWQLTESLRSHLDTLGPSPIALRFRLEKQEDWAYAKVVAPVEVMSNPKFETVVEGRAIGFSVPSAIQSHLSREDNQADRLVVDAVIRALGDMLSHTGHQNTLTSAERKRILDIHAPLGRKKKMFIVVGKGRASVNPQHLPLFRALRLHDIEEQLDGLVDELPKKFPIGELKDPDEHTNVCNEVVKIYLRRLKLALKSFSWESALSNFIAQHEAYWHRRLRQEVTVPTEIECFGNVHSRITRIARDQSRLEETAVALRTVIEILAAEPPLGTQQISMDDSDKVLAMAYHLVNWAMLSDHIHWGILNYKLSILGSGRVGVERKQLTEIWDSFVRAKTIEKVELAMSEFASYFTAQGDAEKRDVPEFHPHDPVFKAEFGLTLSDIAGFHAALMVIGFGQPVPAPRFFLSELKADLSERLQWGQDKIDKAIDLFSLRPRRLWEVAPKGFSADEDILPWRNQRRLSYLRRPLVIGPELHCDKQVLWGARHCQEAFLNLIALVYTGRYKTHGESTAEMRGLIAKINDESGHDFAASVAEWFCDNACENYPEVPVKPGKPLNSGTNLGDIDVLYIDRIRKTIFSIECKNLSYGRNPREIANELERLIGKTPSDTSRIAQHQKRDEWLRNNFDTVASVYHLVGHSWKVISLFVTAEEIPSTYIRAMPLPFVSFTRLEREGLSILSQLAEHDSSSGEVVN
jgi:hypothetical protein